MSPHALPPDHHDFVSESSTGLPLNNVGESKMGALTYWASDPDAKRILFLEAYDSFSNNILALLKRVLGNVSIYVLHMDLTTMGSSKAFDRWTEQEYLSRLACFDAVVCGPGPGTPLNYEDVGGFRHLWTLAEQQMIPVLGICLGFQSLVAASGGRIRRLKRGMHGMVRRIEHQHGREGDIFSGVPAFKATLYHSLCADIGQDEIPEDAWESEKWKSSCSAPDLVPLAWVVEHDRASGEKERILMGVRHAHKPFWGLQYHPESVCTEPVAHEVIAKWFEKALRWNKQSGRARETKTLFAEADSSRSEEAPETAAESHKFAETDDAVGQDTPIETYHFRELDLPAHVDAATILEVLQDGHVGGEDVIMLDASSSSNGDPMAKNAIIAMEVDGATRLEYRVFDDYLTVRSGRDGTGARVPLQASKNTEKATAWSTLTSYWQSRRINGLEAAPEACTFRGGFMGFVTYEAGLEGLTPQTVPEHRPHSRPDICFAWVTKSIVLDYQARKMYVQAIGLAEAPSAWADGVVSQFTSSDCWRSPGSPESPRLVQSISPDQISAGLREDTNSVKVRAPSSYTYEEDVRRCQDFIKAGESYELCLTAQTTMTRPRQNAIDTQAVCVPNGLPKRPRLSSKLSLLSSDWHMYKTLRAKQPAPFGCFMRLGGATLLSSSPERFLRHDAQGHCSMRPMKGTVRKSAAVRTLADAERILHCPKEEAENLMIVDLVMHDLHAVCGPGRVHVAELLKVEEYATVFQMVTVIDGTLRCATDDKVYSTAAGAALPSSSTAAATGLCALGSMLPPGSMTGAPKKRSCEILGQLEGRERGLYSGVVGYFDVTGQADWSVTIRSMFRWDDETAAPLSSGESGNKRQEEVWHIGAGGAVTTLSTPGNEREEMFTKLCGPLGVFLGVS